MVELFSDLCNKALSVYEKKYCAHRHFIRYGGRKRFCKNCSSIFRIRRKKRGRKRKRQSARFATFALRTKTSLRGFAAVIHRSRNQTIGQFHRSVAQWKLTHRGSASFNGRSGKLIGIFDGIWFTILGERYTCLVILLRSVHDTIARVRGLYLLKGDESQVNWQDALDTVLKPQEFANITAIVADGAHGLVAMSKQYHWKYQRCQFHILKDLKLICGKRSGPTQWLRQKALALVKEILDTPDERKARRLKTKLSRLITRPDCPKTVRKKVGGFIKHFGRFRTCYHYPKLRLPHTSNSAECIGRYVRERLGIMRGLNTITSLKYWLDIIFRQRTSVQCLPKLPTKL